ncbi:uncharacterized protein BKA78DRAFT_143670 [Phyllosticta capitalensis]|uniref:uncharacterized protein n=1 Tax=Phyllosticta capitalensis TaxID=121624 RepID=UPI00312D41D4
MARDLGRRELLEDLSPCKESFEGKNSMKARAFRRKDPSKASAPSFTAFALCKPTFSGTYLIAPSSKPGTVSLTSPHFSTRAKHPGPSHSVPSRPPHLPSCTALPSPHSLPSSPRNNSLAHHRKCKENGTTTSRERRHSHEQLRASRCVASLAQNEMRG